MCDNCTEFQQLLYSVERKYDAARAGLYSVIQKLSQFQEIYFFPLIKI